MLPGQHADETKGNHERRGEGIMNAPDTIFHHGLFTTLNRSNPAASAVAIKDGIFTAVGHDNDVVRLAGSSTRIIDLKGRRVARGCLWCIRLPAVPRRSAWRGRKDEG